MKETQGAFYDVVIDSGIEQMRPQNGSSSRGLVGFLILVASREFFYLCTGSSGWIATNVGVGAWAIYMYTTQPRPKLWKLLLATGSIASIVFVLHLLHVG